MNFAKKLKAARAKSGLSQSQAARYLEKPIKTLQCWEQDTRTPDPIIQKYIIEKLDIYTAKRDNIIRRKQNETDKRKTKITK